MSVSRDPPTLLVRLDLEQPPTSLVLCASWEDEQRIRVALSHPSTRRRIIEAVAAALDQLTQTGGVTVTTPPEFLREFPLKEHSTGWATLCPDAHGTSGFCVLVHADEKVGRWRFACVEAGNGDLCGNEPELVRLLGLSDTEIQIDPEDTTATAELAVVPIEAFVAVREASAEALIGTDDQTVLAAGGTAMYYGPGGAGKTTAEIDLAFHVAAGINWLELSVARRGPEA